MDIGDNRLLWSKTPPCNDRSSKKEERKFEIFL